MKFILKSVGLILIMGIFSSFLAGCAKKIGEGVGQGTGIAEGELTGAAFDVQYPLSEYRLAGILLEYSSGELFGADYLYRVVPEKINRAMYFDTETRDYINLENKPISEKQWNRAAEYVRQVQPELMYLGTENNTESTEEQSAAEAAEPLGEETEELDGDSGSFFLIYERDGQQFTARYYNGTAQIMELETILREIAAQSE